MYKKKVRWTYHALERAGELNLRVRELLEAFSRARIYRLSQKQKIYKFNKYGIDSLDFTYYYDRKKDLVFTCKKEELNFVITVTKGRGNVVKRSGT